MGEERAWESGAEEWVAMMREGGHGSHAPAHDAVIHELLPPPSGRALDVGCGEGRFTRALAALGYDVTGVDRSPKLVAAAQAADPDGRYAVGEIESLPFADASVELVLCVNMLMHVERPEAALRELARVLVPGGVLVLALAHPMAEAGEHDEERDGLFVSRYFENEPHPIPLGHGHVAHQHRTIEQYVRASLAAGFVLEDLREVAGHSASTPRYLDLRLSRGSGR